MNNIILVIIILISFGLLFSVKPVHDRTGGHEYNGYYSGKYLDRIAFPVGE